MPAILNATAPKQLAMSLGEVARHFGVDRWRVRRLFERGLLPEGPRVAGCRVFLPEDLEEIGEALTKANYLRPEPAGTGAA